MLRDELTRRSLIARSLATGGGLALARAVPALGRPHSGVPQGVVFAQRLADSHGAHAARMASSGGWVAPPPVNAPARFDLLGVEWRAPADVRIELRVRRA